MSRPSRISRAERIITPEAVRAVDRDCRDLVMSLRALVALLRDPPADGEETAGWEQVLARILEAELNQLAAAVGDVTAALTLQTDSAGRLRAVNLARVVESAVRRTGGRALIDVSGHVVVNAHPGIALQAVTSLLALAFRVADGRVVARVRRSRGRGLVTISAPVEESGRAFARLDQRVGLIRRIVEAEDGSVGVARRGATVDVVIAFPVGERIERFG